MSAGLVSGAFLGYLNSAQQIFQEQYALGKLFPLAFGIVSFSIGLASLLNTRLVMRFGMRFLVRRSLFPGTQHMTLAEVGGKSDSLR